MARCYVNDKMHSRPLPSPKVPGRGLECSVVVNWALPGPGRPGRAQSKVFGYGRGWLGRAAFFCFGRGVPPMTCGCSTATPRHKWGPASKGCKRRTPTKTLIWALIIFDPPGAPGVITGAFFEHSLSRRRVKHNLAVLKAKLRIKKILGALRSGPEPAPNHQLS